MIKHKSNIVLKFCLGGSVYTKRIETSIKITNYDLQ